jgi:hypothetical protein
MSTFITIEESLLASSNPNSGAVNVSPDGSEFTIQLEDGLEIPKDALNSTLEVQEATVWWTVPNIITGQNDKLYITALSNVDVLTPYVITLPQGLYDQPALNVAVQRELETQGAKIDPEPVLTILADDSTQKIILRFAYLNTQVDFTQVDTFREILGFGAQIVGPNAQAPLNYLAPNVAQFNQVNYFLIHSDLTSRGIRFNNTYNQTISQVLIDVAPGSQITSKPFNPARIEANELVGQRRNRIRFWLTDDQNRAVNTNGEIFSCRVVFRYQIEVKKKMQFSGRRMAPL